MPPNLSVSTGFGLFRNSSFVTFHERVVNSYISVFMYIHLLCFAEDNYQESKPGKEKRQSQVSGSYRVTKHRKKPSHLRTKRKSLMIIRIQEAGFPQRYNLPARAGKKSLEQAAVYHEVKVVCCLPTSFNFYS